MTNKQSDIDIVIKKARNIKFHKMSVPEIQEWFENQFIGYKRDQLIFLRNEAIEQYRIQLGNEIRRMAEELWEGEPC